MKSRPILERTLVTIAIVAVGTWTGGVLALGAFAAPAVFGRVPAPASADAMTLAFRRFDRFAVAAVIVALVCETALAAIRPRLGRTDVARGVAAVVSALLVVAQAFVLSPRIDALHRAGAIRGLGPDGMRLDAIHDLAQACGKAQLLFGVVLVALHVVTIDRDRARAQPHS